MPLQLFWLSLYELNCSSTRNWCSLSEPLAREVIKKGLVANLKPPGIKLFFGGSDCEDTDTTKINQHGQIANDSGLVQVLNNYPQEDFGLNTEIYQARIKKESIINNFSALSDQIEEYLKKSSKYTD